MVSVRYELVVLTINLEEENLFALIDDRVLLRSHMVLSFPGSDSRLVLDLFETMFIHFILTVSKPSDFRVERFHLGLANLTLISKVGHRAHQGGVVAVSFKTGLTLFKLQSLFSLVQDLLTLVTTPVFPDGRV